MLAARDRPNPTSALKWSKNVSLEVRRNEVVGLFGENGAGKSKLMGSCLVRFGPRRDLDAQRGAAAALLSARRRRQRRRHGVPGTVGAAHDDEWPRTSTSARRSGSCGSGCVDGARMRATARAQLAQDRRQISTSRPGPATSPSRPARWSGSQGADPRGQGRALAHHPARRTHIGPDRARTSTCYSGHAGQLEGSRASFVFVSHGSTRPSTSAIASA